MQSNSSSIALRGPVTLTQMLLRPFIQPGDLAIDATCGNGKDTLLLAELVGPTGQVAAFDIQPTALERTAARLSEAGLLERVKLHAIGHERMVEVIDRSASAVIFNLGWLPGADRQLVTCPATTLPALDIALELLAPGGLLAITCYPGHAGGDIEARAVLEWSAVLPPNRYHSWRMSQTNVSENAPFCLIVQKATTHAP